MVINPWDEFAAEEAVQLSENHDAETVAISLGNADSTDALKHALAMGVNEAILVDNSDLKGDMWTTASALVAALKSVGDVDLVLTGKQSVDDNSGAVYVGIASKLGILAQQRLKNCWDRRRQVKVERWSMAGRRQSIPLPAVISVAKGSAAALSSFMGIRKASQTRFQCSAAMNWYGGCQNSLGQHSQARGEEDRGQDHRGRKCARKSCGAGDALLAER